MRTRLGLLLIAAALPLTLTACGSSGGTITIGKSSDVTTTTTGIADEDTTTGTSDGSGGSDGSSGTDDTSMPDFSTVPDGLGDCVALTNALSAMGSAMTGESLPADTQKQIDDAAASLPDDVRKDFETLLEAYKKFGQGDIGAAGEAMSDPKFEEASQRLTEYIQKICTGG